jgi:hypothetical protein
MNLPNVPDTNLDEAPSAPGPDDSIDFDDLNRRFQQLKKK